MRVALVLGASGFVARHLIGRLLREDWRVLGAGRSQSAPAWLPARNYFSLDVGDADAVARLFGKVRPHSIVNLAGAGGGVAAELIRTNVTGVSNILAAAREHAPTCRIVLAGSAAEYGRVDPAHLPIRETAVCEPVGEYGRTKLVATVLALEFARTSALEIDVVRPFNVVGPGVPRHLLVGALIERIREAQSAGVASAIHVGNVDTTRDFVAAEDVAGGIVGLLEKEHECGIYNLCSGRAVSIREVLLTLLSFARVPLTWEIDPRLVRPEDVPVSFGSYAKAEAAIGFHPSVQLEHSLRAAWNEQARH